jgi:hypothetical protein
LNTAHFNRVLPKSKQSVTMKTCCFLKQRQILH